MKTSSAHFSKDFCNPGRINIRFTQIPSYQDVSVILNISTPYEKMCRFRKAQWKAQILPMNAHKGNSPGNQSNVLEHWKQNFVLNVFLKTVIIFPIVLVTLIECLAEIKFITS